MRPSTIDLGPASMPRVLRNYLLGCVAAAFAYVALQVREPLRFDAGEPWPDAQIALDHTSWQPGSRDVLARHVYRMIAWVGGDDLAIHRGFSFALSLLGAWWLFQYVRRMWDDTTALLATTLFTTSSLWLTAADSLARPPLVFSACFLALWGLVHAMETGKRRLAVASACGAFVCMLAGSDLRLILPACLLLTIHARRGDLLAWRNLRLIAIVAIGCFAGQVAGALIAGGPVDASSNTTAGGMVWWFTAAFTPMCWIAVTLACWRAARAPTLGRVFQDAVPWLLTATVVGLVVVGKTGQMVDALPAVPFHAIGSALVISRLFGAGRRFRVLGLAWAVLVPVWGGALVLANPRTVLDRDDVDQVRAYLSRADHNDFVIANVVANSVLEVAFHRRALPAVVRGHDPRDTRHARRWALGVLESTGTDYFHAVIVQSPGSRYFDALDRLVAVGARRVLRLHNFDVYRVDRADVLAIAGRSLPVVRELDFGSVASSLHMLLGWWGPTLANDEVGVSHIGGYPTCGNPLASARAGAPARNACETERTATGTSVVGERFVNRAQLMIRVDRQCDLRLTITVPPTPPSQLLRWIASTPRLGVALNGFTASQCVADLHAAFVVPARFVHAGINILTIARGAAGPLPPRDEIRTLTIEPVCSPEP